MNSYAKVVVFSLFLKLIQRDSKFVKLFTRITYYSTGKVWIFRIKMSKGLSLLKDS